MVSFTSGRARICGQVHFWAGADVVSLRVRGMLGSARRIRGNTGAQWPMKRETLYKVALVLLALGCAGFAFLALRMARRFYEYQGGNPPISLFRKDRCKQPGLVGHWKFDEVRGRMTPDSSSAHNDGTLGVTPGLFAEWRTPFSKVVDGKVGKALDFPSKQWVSAENSACFATEQFTVAAWVLLDDPGVVPTVISKSAWPYNGWWLCTTTMNPQGRERFVDFGISWGSDFTHVESGYQLPLHEWHHIIASLDNINQEAQFFIDGKPGKKQTNVHKWLVNWDHDLFIGDYDGSGRWPWKGKLDDVRFYNKTLTEPEALAISNAGAPKR